MGDAGGWPIVTAVSKTAGKVRAAEIATVLQPTGFVTDRRLAF